jgi:HSP20 family protein
MSNTVTKPDNGAPEAARAEQQKIYLTPRVNIHENKDGYVLHAEMPGVGKDGLELLLENDELTILGHRKQVESPGDYVHQEAATRDYRRIFTLDPSIDTTRIGARIDQGLLTLELPKAEKVKPRKIQVS